MERPDSSPPPARRHWGRAFAILALLGATLGSALDGIHTHFGVTTYPHPIFWRMAAWTPLLFGSAFTIGLLRPLLAGHPALRTAPPRLPTVGLAMALFVAAYFASSLPLGWPGVTALLGAIFVVGYGVCDRSAAGLVIAVGAAAGGPLVESILVGRGAFVHLQPLYFGVPGWLPALYLSAAVALTTLAHWLVEDRDSEGGLTGRQ